MDFEMISYEGLTEEMFVLPLSEQPWLSGNKNINPKIYIGLSRWTYRENLKKKNSPPPQPGTPGFYSALFNAIELNATHDDIPDTEKINKWYRSVERSDFNFCPEFYKGITHSGPIGLTKMGITNEFIKRMREFKEKLGVSFLQLPHLQQPAKENIIAYLKLLPRDFPLSIGFTHEEWFTNPGLLSEFIKELNTLNIGTVITDTPARRDTVHMQLSNGNAFIRFYCQGDHELDLFRIEQWKKQLRSWFLQGLEKCYFFLHIQSQTAEEDFINYVQYELKF
ncbi:MAG: DUF72 domain-containing protein [Ferruginibacter sp.]